MSCVLGTDGDPADTLAPARRGQRHDRVGDESRNPFRAGLCNQARRHRLPGTLPASVAVAGRQACFLIRLHVHVRRGALRRDQARRVPERRPARSEVPWPVPPVSNGDAADAADGAGNDDGLDDTDTTSDSHTPTQLKA